MTPKIEQPRKKHRLSQRPSDSCLENTVQQPLSKTQTEGNRKIILQNIMDSFIMYLYNSTLRKRSWNLTHCTDKDTNQRNRDLLNVPYLVSGGTKTRVTCDAKANILPWACQGQKAAGRGLEKSEETKLGTKHWVTGLASSPSFHLSSP